MGKEMMTTKDNNNVVYEVVTKRIMVKAAMRIIVATFKCIVTARWLAIERPTKPRQISKTHSLLVMKWMHSVISLSMIVMKMEHRHKHLLSQTYIPGTVITTLI